jgi:hypothetical protein
MLREAERLRNFFGAARATTRRKEIGKTAKD